MTKRRAENKLPPDIIPHKRCLRSLSNIDDKPVGGEVTTVQSGNPPQLPSNLGQRCRKRPNYNEDSPNTDDMPKKIPANRANPMLGDKNTCKSRKFEDAGKPVARPPSHALEVESKKEKEDKNTTGDKVMPTDEDLTAFNSFQFWRVPLPELDLSLLETESSPGPNDTISTKDLEAMET